MSSKAELYKLLLDTSPYGTLFFVYGICVDCNPKAQQILGCEKRLLLGASLEDIELSEPLALASLKQQVNTALEEKITDLNWRQKIGDVDESIMLHVHPLDESNKELIVTLMPQVFSATDADADADAEGDKLQLAEDLTPEVSPNVVNMPPLAFQRERGSLKAQVTAPAKVTKHKYPDQRDVPAAANTETVMNRLASRDTANKRRDSDRDIYIDGLTHLPNRQLLIEAIRQHSQDNEDKQLCAALMLIDLDHFKDINDSWGHDVGDQVLAKVARAIEPVIGDAAMVARMSGDEFMVFLPDAGCNPGEGAVSANALAMRVSEAIAHPIFYDGNEFILTASVGIALLTDHKTTAERILQYADTAMYEAKRQGRNGVAFFNQSIGDNAAKQVGLNTRLHKAVDNQEFELYIQPQVSIDDGRLVGGEALLRWVNSGHITSMPSEFIPLLESSGLIVDVGHWVIRTSCEYIRDFINEGLWEDHMRLGINISPRQFNDPELMEVIEHSIHNYGIDPKYLNFEITESLLIDDVEDVIKKMIAIKRLGAKFSIDDFGVGYSSMIYLKRLPFDWLKIDREFIRNIHGDSESRGIVDAILAVSKQYGLSVTAEGVEDQESLEVLRNAGCDIYQGAYFSMPVPVEQFRKYLAA
jgi:diguanylate cyclase (GGDEF)-like protein